CTLDSSQAKSNLKFIFVIDKSTSNSEDAGDSLATDPDGTRRYPPLLNFLDSGLYTNDSSVYYSLIHLRSQKQTKIIWEFNNDQLAFRNKIQNEYDNLSDSGWTDYLEALNQIHNLIEKDIIQSLQKD